MQTYLVGGAVRDKLLGLPVRERDWVVVGSNTEEMLANGFKQVGKDFPVFLHPETKEEYALARTERKTGPGYKGFVVNSSPQITLEQDLNRRDLTINAIAEDENGNIIDPYKGQIDLQKRTLRHISNAFGEDPVRILRVARFTARFGALQFDIAPETINLMQSMVKNGEIKTLVPERVWSELIKALHEPLPQLFFQTLGRCNAIPDLFPEEKALDQGILALEQACALSKETVIRFAAWAFHLGEQNITALCQRLKAPKEYLELASLVAQFHTIFDKSTELPPPDILATLKSLDGFRRPERFEAFLLAAEAVSRSLPERQNWPHPQREYLHTTLLTASQITAKNLTKVGLEGDAIAQELDIHRRAAISKVKRTYRWAKFN